MFFLNNFNKYAKIKALYRENGAALLILKAKRR